MLKHPHPNGTHLRILACFVLLLGLLTSALCQGGPPLITDDPGTPGNHHWEINIAYTRTRFASGAVYELPHLDLNYGYGDNVQLKLEGPLATFDGFGTEFTGLSYTNWGVKWRFLEEKGNRPAMSTYPQVIFVGSPELMRLGVTDPGTDVFLPVEVLKSFGKFALDGETGVLFRQYTTTQLSSGICAELDITPTFALLGEVHDITSTGFVTDQLVWNLGLRKDLNEHASILFSTGRAFGPQAADNPGFMLYLAIQLRL